MKNQTAPLKAPSPCLPLEKGPERSEAEKDLFTCPLVSIIIPAYNVEDYIHRALDSSLRQTYPSIEAIVIDDGSSDRTRQVIQRYAVRDDRIRAFQQEHAGVSAARNHGLRRAQGEYIIFLDADDWLEPDAVEVLADALTRNPDRLIVADIYYVFMGRKNKLYRWRWRPGTPSQTAGVSEAIERFRDLNISSVRPKIFRRSLIEKHALHFEEKIFYGEDNLFTFCYLRKTKGVVYLNTAVWNYLERPGSLMHSPYGRQRATSIDAKRMMIDHPDNSEGDRKFLRRLYTEGACTVISEAMLAGQNGGSEEIKNLRKRARAYAGEYFSLRGSASIREPGVFVLLYFPVLPARMIFKAFKALRLFRKLLKCHGRRYCYEAEP